MLDRNLLRNDPERVREAAAAKGEPCPLEEWSDLDRKRRDLLQEAEEYRHERNQVSQSVGERKKNGQDASELIEKGRELGQRIAEIDDQLSSVDEWMGQLELRFPNLPDPDVPVGPTGESNRLVRSWGELPQFDFQPLPHWDLLDGLLDQQASGLVAGSNFVLLRGWAARLQRALIDWMLDYHTAKGYEEVWPPFVAVPESMRTTAQIPKLESDMYRIEEDGFYLVPTGEVPLTNMYRDRIMDESELPVRMCAYTPCFRREAGSYGKETRGLNRVHQFEKVELVHLEHPHGSDQALEQMVDHVEKLIQDLGIPYRVQLLATGDLSFAAARCYDIEIWSAGQQRWLEVSSISNFRDFQARRGRIRFRRSEGGKPQFVHTLNGSGTALPRLIAALVENGQRSDGSVSLPGFLDIQTG